MIDSQETLCTTELVNDARYDSRRCDAV